MAGGGHNGEGRGQEGIKDSGLGCSQMWGAGQACLCVPRMLLSLGRQRGWKAGTGASHRAEVWVGSHPRGEWKRSGTLLRGREKDREGTLSPSGYLSSHLFHPFLSSLPGRCYTALFLVLTSCMPEQLPSAALRALYKC